MSTSKSANANAMTMDKSLVAAVREGIWAVRSGSMYHGCVVNKASPLCLVMCFCNIN